MCRYHLMTSTEMVSMSFQHGHESVLQMTTFKAVYLTMKSGHQELIINNYSPSGGE